MVNKKDVNHEKRVFTRFFCVLRLEIFLSKPKMNFTEFTRLEGLEPSHGLISLPTVDICTDSEQIIPLL